MASNRDVVVMMDFGKDVELRKNNLMYHRVRYIVEKWTAVRERETGEQIDYRTQVFNVKAGTIKDKLERAIVKSDVMIGILSSRNLNVVYELAMRSLLRGEWILLIEGDDTEDAVPIYLKDVARIRTDIGGGKAVTAWIKAKAEASADIYGFTGSLPPELQMELEETIRKHDGSFQSELQEALHTVEHERVPRPELPKFIEHLNVGEILSNWNTAFPYSIWRIRWKGKGRKEGYRRDLVLGQPTLFGANPHFASMILRSGQRPFPPDPDGPDALTVDDIRHALDPYVETNAFQYFWSDLNDLADRLMEGGRGQFGNLGNRVKPPITFRHNHPDENFKDKSLLVCPVAVKVFGEDTQQHLWYLLTVFVEVAGSPSTLQAQIVESALAAR